MTEPFASIRAILFDVDGTLFSSEHIIGEVYRTAFTEFMQRFPEKRSQASVPELSAILAEIGKPVVEIFRNLAPGLSETDRGVISALVLSDLIRRIGRGEGEHYPDVNETVAALHRRGYELFAASNGRLAYIEAILAFNGTRSFFRAVPAIDGQAIKNKNDLVRSILSAYALDGTSAVLVGDRASDRDAAQLAGLPFIACRYGHTQDPAEHAGAVVFIDRIRELLGLFPGKT